MLQLNTEVDRLHQQYHLRIIGENGVAKGIIDFVNPIETWWENFVTTVIREAIWIRR